MELDRHRGTITVDGSATRRAMKRGEPGFEPGFTVLETVRIAVNPLPRERGSLCGPATPARPVHPGTYVRMQSAAAARVNRVEALIGTGLSDYRDVPRRRLHRAGIALVSARDLARSPLPRDHRSLLRGHLGERWSACPALSQGHSNRRIELAAWQQEIVDLFSTSVLARPDPFPRLAGPESIQRRPPQERSARVCLSRYFFRNLSDDILGLFFEPLSGRPPERRMSRRLRRPKALRKTHARRPQALTAAPWRPRNGVGNRS